MAAWGSLSELRRNARDIPIMIAIFGAVFGVLTFFVERNLEKALAEWLIVMVFVTFYVFGMALAGYHPD
jgi:hypothetical protein